MPSKSPSFRTGCNLCQGIEFETVGLKDRKQKPLQTVVCNRCGLVSHAIIPSEADLARYYEREYRKDYHAELTPSPQRVVREWNRGQALVDRLRPFMRPKDSVFEVGAGIGCNVKQFELGGFQASGIEPGEGFRRFSREELQANIGPGFLEDQNELGQHDVILLVHVLEHLRDPLASLTHLRKMLGQGGRLYVEVPNLAGPHAAPGKMFHYAHIYNFTHLTLKMLGEAAGLTLKHAFTPHHDKNVALLFTKGAQQKWYLDPQSYAHTMSGLKRYSKLTYHLRASYLLERVSTVARHSSARIAANARAKAIVSRCQGQLITKAA